MSRIAERFALLRRQNRAALVTFAMGGDPDSQLSLQLFKGTLDFLGSTIGKGRLAPLPPSNVETKEKVVDESTPLAWCHPVLGLRDHVQPKNTLCEVLEGAIAIRLKLAHREDLFSQSIK